MSMGKNVIIRDKPSGAKTTPTPTHEQKTDIQTIHADNPTTNTNANRRKRHTPHTTKRHNNTTTNRHYVHTDGGTRRPNDHGSGHLNDRQRPTHHDHKYKQECSSKGTYNTSCLT